MCPYAFLRCRCGYSFVHLFSWLAARCVSAPGRVWCVCARSAYSAALPLTCCCHPRAPLQRCCACDGVSSCRLCRLTWLCAGVPPRGAHDPPRARVAGPLRSRSVPSVRPAFCCPSCSRSVLLLSVTRCALALEFLWPPFCARCDRYASVVSAPFALLNAGSYLCHAHCSRRAHCGGGAAPGQQKVLERLPLVLR